MWKWLFILSLIYSATLNAGTQVLLFAGSTREGSVNKQLIAEAAAIARETDTTVVVIDLKDYPMTHYDADLEAKEGMPACAKQLRKLMIGSNAIFIACPEYNGSLPSVLKNALDWASRNEQGEPSRDAYKGKHFGIMSASPGPGGGARALTHLRTILENVGGIVTPIQVSVPDAYTAFNEEGKLKDPKLRAELSQLIKETVS